MNSLTIRSRSNSDAPIGTRSLSCRFTPQAPTSARSATASTGGSGSRTTSPNGSRPRLPTVHRPNENLCSGFGVYGSAMNALERGIQARVGGVLTVHRGCMVWPRLRDRRPAHQSIACRVHRWPESHADRGQNRGAVRSTLVGLYGVDGAAVDISLDLAPERRPRPAAPQPHAVDRHLELGKNRERIAQAERHALHDRPDDVASG